MKRQVLILKRAATARGAECSRGLVQKSYFSIRGAKEPISLAVMAKCILR